MPVITDIQQQKRAVTRYSIYLDGEYGFSLTDLELSTSGLRVGRALTPEEVAVWEAQSIEGKAYNAALRYLSYRPRSRREVQDYLITKYEESAVIDRVLVRLEALGLINDTAFAAIWIENRQMLKPRSRRRLAQELAQKGLNREVIEGALTEIDDAAQDSVLEQLITKKRRLSSYQDIDKLTAYLARQGFEYDQIKKALRRLDD